MINLSYDNFLGRSLHKFHVNYSANSYVAIKFFFFSINIYIYIDRNKKRETWKKKGGREKEEGRIISLFSIQRFSPIHKLKQKRNPLCDLTIKNPITSLMHF